MLVIRRLFGTGTNCIAPSGLPLLLCLFPGLAPWAFLSRPCGASFAPETSYSERPSYRPVSHGRDGHATKPIVSCFTTETRGYSPCIVVYSVVVRKNWKFFLTSYNAM